MKKQAIVCGESEIKKAVGDMADEIINDFNVVGNLVIVGIHTRGVFLARRIQRRIQLRTGVDVPVGTLDITLYLDDWTKLHGYPIVRSTHIPVPLDNRDVVLIDDVLFTGRTVRSALDALVDFGRPQLVHLAVLVDRGHRELPICAQYTGFTIKTTRNQHVHVFLKEVDGVDQVVIAES